MLLLIETGLRSVDALRLPFDPVTTDQAGAPYLVFRNHKLSREAVVPISDRVLAEIRAQQAELRGCSPEPPPVLFPRPCRNADGRYPLETHDAQPAASPLARGLRLARRSGPAGQDHLAPVPPHARHPARQPRGAA